MEAPYAGLVIYTREGENLEGLWTHKDLNGHFAREIVFGASKDRFVGTWKVDIYRPDDLLFWRGELTSAVLGEAFSLQWNGTFTESGDASSYVGIGAGLPDGKIVATFEEVRI